MKVYTYVYNQLFDFPPSEISYEVMTTNNFYSNVNRMIRGKSHLHHSHITGDIIGYAHDFCNTAYFEETTSQIPFIAHNVFGFDLFYWIKTYIASAWCSKELNIAGNNQPVITTRIYVLHKITIALKFMSYINSDLQIPAKKLQTPG